MSRALALEDLGSEGLVVATSPTVARVWRMRALLAGSALVFLAVAGLSLWWPWRDRGPAGTLRQLTFEAGVAITPALSPDGKLLAYATDRSGEGQLDIWLKQTIGGEPVRLTRTYRPESSVSAFNSQSLSPGIGSSSIPPRFAATSG